ncbi:PRTRC system protein A [Massilia aerilata]|uniref:PRTRC system protein A n=1 Tax=Massilia aerilata TaxID=453817 RepID=A0ABW0S4U0_9BURK
MLKQEITSKFAELLDIARGSFDHVMQTTRDNFDVFVETAATLLREERPLPLAVDEVNTPAELLQMDMALLAAAPIAAVPRHAPFHPLQENGHRFLLAEGGLFVEVRRPWLHFIHQLAEHKVVAIPYGPVAPKCEMDFGKLGTALAQLKEFAVKARADAPIEAAASVLWDHRQKTWRIEYPEIIGEASASRIQYRQVEPGPDESVAIDLHSHGHLNAFFSETDDADDRGAVKVSGVYGNLDTDKPTVAFRLCVLGLYIPLVVPAEKIFG